MHCVMMSDRLSVSISIEYMTSPLGALTAYTMLSRLMCLQKSLWVMWVLLTFSVSVRTDVRSTNNSWWLYLCVCSYTTARILGTGSRPKLWETLLLNTSTQQAEKENTDKSIHEDMMALLNARVEERSEPNHTYNLDIIITPVVPIAVFCSEQEPGYCPKEMVDAGPSSKIPDSLRHSTAIWWCPQETVQSVSIRTPLIIGETLLVHAGWHLSKTT